MSKPSAKVIAHSSNCSRQELITFEIELHRFILPEFNTHRVFSRNFQSSRAVPVDKMIQQVWDEPAIPLHFGANQPGMVADNICNNPVSLDGENVDIEYFWRESAKSACELAKSLNEAGYHKQIVNRILEPYMWTKGVVTTTLEGLQSFFKLRIHKDAQPEIKALAEQMAIAYATSVPKDISYGSGYHLPYITEEHDDLSLEDKIKVSCSCTAQVSYRRLDDSIEKAMKVFEMLNLPENGVYLEDPPHFSPAEHVAACYSTIGTYEPLGGNFSGNWVQYRKLLERGDENLIYESNKE